MRYATNSAAKESQSGALSKTLLALQFYNTYGAEPVIVREEQLNPDLTFSKLYKYTKASWPGLDNMQDYITQSDDGNLTLRCSDDEEIATVTLSSSGFQVMCSFLYLLPFKKPQWVELNDLERSVMSVGGQSEGGRSHTTTSRRMKMAYEYTRVTQVFTLNSVPACWIYPVSLLLGAYTSQLAEGQDLAIHPNFPDADTLAATQEEYYTELVTGREYQTVLPTKVTTDGQPSLDIDAQSCSGLNQADLSLL